MSLPNAVTLNNFKRWIYVVLSSFRIDATKKKFFGRYINDSKDDFNLAPRKIVVDGEPKICFFAVKDIEKGQELTYDYGPSDHSWRQQPQYKKPVQKPNELNSTNSAKNDHQKSNAKTVNTTKSSKGKSDRKNRKKKKKNVFNPSDTAGAVATGSETGIHTNIAENKGMHDNTLRQTEVQNSTALVAEADSIEDVACNATAADEKTSHTQIQHRIENNGIVGDSLGNTDIQHCATSDMKPASTDVVSSYHTDVHDDTLRHTEDTLDTECEAIEDEVWEFGPLRLEGVSEQDHGMRSAEPVLNSSDTAGAIATGSETGIHTNIADDKGMHGNTLQQIEVQNSTALVDAADSIEDDAFNATAADEKTSHTQIQHRIENYGMGGDSLRSTDIQHCTTSDMKPASTDVVSSYHTDVHDDTLRPTEDTLDTEREAIEDEVWEFGPLRLEGVSEQDHGMLSAERVLSPSDTAGSLATGSETGIHTNIADKKGMHDNTLQQTEVQNSTALVDAVDSIEDDAFNSTAADEKTSHTQIQHRIENNGTGGDSLGNTDIQHCTTSDMKPASTDVVSSYHTDVHDDTLRHTEDTLNTEREAIEDKVWDFGPLEGVSEQDHGMRSAEPVFNPSDTAGAIATGSETGIHTNIADKKGMHDNTLQQTEVQNSTALVDAADSIEDDAFNATAADEKTSHTQIQHRIEKNGMVCDSLGNTDIQHSTTRDMKPASTDVVSSYHADVHDDTLRHAEDTLDTESEAIEVEVWDFGPLEGVSEQDHAMRSAEPVFNPSDTARAIATGSETRIHTNIADNKGMYDNTLQQIEVQNFTALVAAADSIEDDAFNATAADEKTSHTQIQHRIENNGMVGDSLGNTDIHHCTSSDMKPASTDVVSSYHTDVHDDTLPHTEDTLDTEREANEDEVWKFGPLRLDGVSEQDHGMRSAEPVLNSSEIAGAIATGSETGIHTNITDNKGMHGNTLQQIEVQNSTALVEAADSIEDVACNATAADEKTSHTQIQHRIENYGMGGDSLGSTDIQHCTTSDMKPASTDVVSSYHTDVHDDTLRQTEDTLDTEREAIEDEVTDFGPQEGVSEQDHAMRSAEPVFDPSDTAGTIATGSETGIHTNIADNKGMHDNTLQQIEVQNSTALVAAADSIEDDAFNATAADEKTSHTQIQHRIENNGIVGDSLGNTDIQHCTTSDMKPASTDVVSSYHTDVHDDTLPHTEDTLDTEREAIEDEVWKFGPLRLDGVSEQDHGMRSAEPVLNSSEIAGAIATGSETGIHTNITDNKGMHGNTLQQIEVQNSTALVEAADSIEDAACNATAADEKTSHTQIQHRIENYGMGGDSLGSTDIQHCTTSDMKPASTDVVSSYHTDVHDDTLRQTEDTLDTEREAIEDEVTDFGPQEGVSEQDHAMRSAEPVFDPSDTAGAIATGSETGIHTNIADNKGMHDNTLQQIEVQNSTALVAAADSIEDDAFNATAADEKTSHTQIQHRIENNGIVGDSLGNTDIQHCATSDMKPASTDVVSSYHTDVHDDTLPHTEDTLDTEREAIEDEVWKFGPLRLDGVSEQDHGMGSAEPVLNSSETAGAIATGSETGIHTNITDNKGMHGNTLQQIEVQNSTALVEAADSIEDDAFNATAADEKTSHTQIQHRIENYGMGGDSLGSTDIQHCTTSDMKPASTDVVSSYHTDVHDDTLRQTEDTLDTEREAIEDEVTDFGPQEGVSEQDHAMRSAELVFDPSDTAGAIATGSETGIHTNIADNKGMHDNTLQQTEVQNSTALVTAADSIEDDAFYATAADEKTSHTPIQHRIENNGMGGDSLGNTDIQHCTTSDMKPASIDVVSSYHTDVRDDTLRHTEDTFDTESEAIENEVWDFGPLEGVSEQDHGMRSAEPVFNPSDTTGTIATGSETGIHTNIADKKGMHDNTLQQTEVQNSTALIAGINENSGLNDDTEAPSLIEKDIRNYGTTNAIKHVEPEAAQRAETHQSTLNAELEAWKVNSLY